MPAQKYPGAAVPTSIVGGISAIATSAVLAETTGWPDGSDGDFVVVIDPDQPTQEKMLCSSRSGTTLNISQRGYDGTAAASHDVNAVIRPSMDAASLQRHEDHIFDPSAAHAATAISFSPAGAVAATTVQAAIVELDSDKSAVGHTHSASGSVLLNSTHTWTIAAPAVESGDADFIIPFTVRLATGHTAVIESVSHKINGGTSVTWDLTKNGSTVTGFTSLSTTTSNTNTNPSNVAVADGDKIKPDVSAVTGSPVNWEVTVVLLHTGTVS